MTWFDSVVLGLVEGITEFLPISSTGHLVLVSGLLGIAQTDFQKTFEIVIQLGAILAVVVLYWRSFLNSEVLKRLVVAFIPTGIIGLALYKFAKTYLLGNEVVVLWALLLGGVALIAFEYLHQERADATSTLESISYRQALCIGLFQAIAIIPGISRSGASILGGLFVGLGRKTIVEFSFLLAVPTIVAASGLSLVKNASTLTFENTGLLVVGFVVAFLVAWASIVWLLRFVQYHSFVSFGVYRIILALLFWFLVIN